MGRYIDIFELRRATDNIPSFTIKERETDVYITFNMADRLDTISNRIYGSPDYWWIILNANNYQIEFDIALGEIIRVPYPLTEVVKEIQGKVT